MKINWKRWILILAGSLTWSWTMVKSGWLYNFGLGFWGANGHDAIWHIALIESLAKGSFQMPVFAGFLIQNYHIGFDIILAFLHRLTFIPISTLYFQIFPPLVAIGVGLMTYRFVLEWIGSKKAALWSLFFVYFGGSFGWVINLFRDRSLGGESLFWSQQAVSSLINPPFALSLLFLLTGLIFLNKYLKREKVVHLILTALFFGLLIEVKIYAGLLALGGLLCALIFELVSKSKPKKEIVGLCKVFLLSLLVSLVLFIFFEKGSGSLIVFQPFWFLENMMGLSDRVGWQKFYSAMMNYKSGHVWIKAISAYIVAFVIFLVGNAGTRLVFVKYYFKKKFGDLSWVDVFLLSISTAGFTIPMFFLQKGTPWNTIQFFYYSLFAMGIMAGVAMAKLSFLNTTFIKIAVVVLTIPTTIGTLWFNYIPQRPPAMLSNAELSALAFLKNQPDGIVLTYPYDSAKAKAAEANPPRPLYLYESTAYVSAFSTHEVFLEDQVNLDITGYQWKDRLNEVKLWYVESDEVDARAFLSENKIKYVYWLHGQRGLLGESQLGLENIYQNDEVTIYKVELKQN